MGSEENTFEVDSSTKEELSIKNCNGPLKTEVI